MDIVKVKSAILIFAFISAGFVFGGKVLACGDPPPEGCPSACDTWDPVKEKCIAGCQCACMGCEESTGYCYEDCDIVHGYSCCCSSDNSNGHCCSSDKTQVSYSTGLNSVVSGIESGINSIPNVTASGWSASVSFTAEKGEQCCHNECCDGDCVDYYKVNGSVEMTGSVSVTAPGLGWEWHHQYGSLGRIDASLGITITPSITVDSASILASGKDSDCDSCLTLSGAGSGTGTITCMAGGAVTVTAFPESDWLNYSLTVNISAEAEVGASAGASGTYKKGSGCNPPTGFCLTHYGASDVEATGTVTFQIGPLGPYSATSAPVTIITGCSVFPEC